MNQFNYISDEHIERRISDVVKKENDEIVKLVYDYLDLQMPDELELLVGFLNGTIKEIESDEGDPIVDTRFEIKMTEENQPFVIWIDKRLNLYEKRFQIARGLGRFFLFALHSEGDIRREDLKYIESNWIVTDFAERFLVPEFRVAELLRDNGEVPSPAQIAEHFGVDISLAEKRLKDLRLLL